VDRRVIVASVLALVLVGAACSGGSDNGKGKAKGNPVSTNRTTSTSVDPNLGWAPGDVARARAAAIRLQQAGPGQCQDVQLLPRAAYLTAAERLDIEPADAVAVCEMFGDTVELSVFGSDTARDAYVRARTLSLCRRGRRGQVALPALHWVVGDRYTVQLTHEGPARNLADALRGEYVLEKCPGEADVTWTAAGEARVDALVEQLQARPEVKCSPALFLDYPQYKNDERYKDRLPAAYLECAGRGNTVIYVAAFEPGGDVTPSAFIAGESEMLCRGGRNIGAVEGDDFAVIATNVRVAALAAVATGGRALPPAC
jgi:hypothetical protein